jgi:hypothetical protein
VRIKLGDLVVRKDENRDFLFQVTGFDGEYIILRGLKIPIFTVSMQENLIKINKNRFKLYSGIRLVK